MLIKGLFDNNADAIMIIDEKHDIVKKNQAAEVFLKYIPISELLASETIVK
jgi:hypothetical protein